MPANLFFDQLGQRWEEEGLFARDEDGQLIRYVAKTQEDYDKSVTITIDGLPITVRKATPTKNAQGEIVYEDAAGRTRPRDTTIHDAVTQLLERRNAPLRAAGLPLVPSPVPTLCHREHLHPVGVCRVCAVAVGKVDRGKLKFQLKPACVHPVEEGMEIVTLGYKAPATALPASALDDEKKKAEEQHKECQTQRNNIARNVRVLLELLAGDHLPHMPSADTPREQLTDLERLILDYGMDLGLEHRRFPASTAPPRPKDDSSPLIRVDHSACILCDRCSRACTDVKENFVIARAGKGYASQISFDLGMPMGQSSCVECGECMLSCPTSALTFRKPIESDWFKEQTALPRGKKEAKKTAVTPKEMEDNDLLSTLPWRYRQWNQSSIVRWRMEPGDELCVLNDYGSTAFILNDGEFSGWSKNLEDARPFAETGRTLKTVGPPDFGRKHTDKILGEMACLNHHKRSATIRATTKADVFEIRRNVLHTLLRDPAARNILERAYRQAGLNNHLRDVWLFEKLDPADHKRCYEILARAMASHSRAAPDPAELPEGQRSTRLVDLVRVEPGQSIFRQGERADCFYMIRIGYVKVSETFGGEERVLNYLGPNKGGIFGEIACLGDYPEIVAALPVEFRAAYPNRRTASCSALDDVELVRIDRETFLELVRAVPAVKQRLIDHALKSLSQSRTAPAAAAVKPGAAPGSPLPVVAAPQAASGPRPSSSALRAFTDQGLYNAQRLLVLDLEACTRCDECTKACSDTHGGITRLIREGLRFDKWLVAGSCRSCSDPYCLVGCPVDAIHRAGLNLEIGIESHCIGCGLCANNCPYGNINMHGATEQAAGKAELRYRATTCDLCNKIVGSDYTNVSCVYACPHQAAFRMTGEQLLQQISK